MSRVDYLFNDVYWRGNLTATQEYDTREGIFKGGSLLLKPSVQTYKRIMHALATTPKLDSADQTLLNQVFHDEWHAKPPAERMPQENLLCSAYCVLAQLRPQYVDAFERMLVRAPFFDSQGKNKYWSMPKPHEVQYPLCLPILNFAMLWLALAYAPTDDVVRQVLAMFKPVRVRTKAREFDFSIMEVAVGAAFKAFRDGTVDANYYTALQRITKDMMQMPPFRKEEWGSSSSASSSTSFSSSSSSSSRDHDGIRGSGRSASASEAPEEL